MTTNNRQIKFRAWVKGTGWESVFTINQDGDVFHEVPNPLRLGEYLEMMIDPEDVWLQQFTGLKDKNGKEIYEGDIVMGLGVVRWYDKDAKYMLYFNNEERPTVELLAASYSEVIGNVYQNKELL